MRGRHVPGGPRCVGRRRFARRESRSRGMSRRGGARGCASSTRLSGGSPRQSTRPVRCAAGWRGGAAAARGLQSRLRPRTTACCWAWPFAVAWCAWPPRRCHGGAAGGGLGPARRQWREAARRQCDDARWPRCREARRQCQPRECYCALPGCGHAARTGFSGRKPAGGDDDGARERRSTVVGVILEHVPAALFLWVKTLSTRGTSDGGAIGVVTFLEASLVETHLG